MPVSAGTIETFTSWRSFLTSAAGSEILHPGAERPLDFHQVDVDDVAGIEAGDPHRAADADALGVAKDHVDGALRSQEAGPSLAMPTKTEQPATATITIRPTHTSRADDRVLIWLPPCERLPVPLRLVLTLQPSRLRQERRAVKRNRMIHQHEPARIHDQDRHDDRQAARNTGFDQGGGRAGCASGDPD